MQDRNIIVISTRSIFIALFILFLIWVLWMIKVAIIILFISLILALALEPLVEWLRVKKLPHGVAVILTVLFALLLFLGLASVAIAPLLQQTNVLAQNFPSSFNLLLDIPGLGVYAQSFNDALFAQLSETAGGVVSVTLGAFSGALTITMMLVFTTYILLDFENLRTLFISFFAKKQQGDIKDLVKSVEHKLGGWLRGQVLLMLIVGCATYVGLSILGIEYALALAVIAGLLEVVPIMGPIVATIPAIIVGFSISPIMGLAVGGLYILIQQLENHIIVPQVMKKAVGLNPLLTIIVLLIGAQLLGIVGALIAIPTTILIIEIAKYVLKLDIPFLNQVYHRTEKYKK